MQKPLAAHLANRAVARVGGADRSSFLQGLISNDIARCIQGRPLYAALLSPQGKFLHDLFIHETGVDFLVDCEADGMPALLRKLASYKLRAKVTLTEASNEFDIWAAWGAAHYAPPFVPDPRLASLGGRGIFAKGAIPDGVDATSREAYDLHRLDLGVADGGRDMLFEKSPLLEGNFDYLNGVSWTKGCYVGQELTARMHHRNLVKKRLLPVTILGRPSPAGTIVTVHGEDIGDMRSSAGEKGIALLNLEKVERAIESRAALECGAGSLTIHWPDWMQKSGL